MTKIVSAGIKDLKEAATLLDKNQFEQALTKLDCVIANDVELRNSSIVWSLKASTLHFMKRYDEELAIYDKLSNLEPRAETHQRKGWIVP